jgi:glycosyltransferase involved in cell wall biosynthesis/GT2 family glycosyltransferase
MDAETTIAVARTTEPLSGMAILRVTGYWQAPRDMPPPIAVEVRYGGQVAIRADLVSAEADDVPAGCRRFNIGTQLPEESGVGDVSVVLIHAAGEQLVYLRPWDEVGAEAPPPAPGFLQRVARSLLSGEVLSPGRWLARIQRFRDRIFELRLRVRYKLLARQFRPRSAHDAYLANTALTPRLREAMLAAVDRFHFKPTFSILVPVYNVDPRWLKEAVDSVRGQIYPHWELCLADDRSTNPALLRYLDELPRDPRIKLVRSTENGHICRATNSAADLATGQFIALLDHDDALAANALFAMAERLQACPDADLLYSDEDKIDADGRHYDPQFKPDWSPELLFSYNYINHFTVIRRSVFEKAGRYRPGYEGSQDHDLLLRVTELTDRVQHVPQVLYHWRSLPSSTAAAATVKTYVHTAGRKAVEDALARRGASVKLDVPPFAQRLNLPVLAITGLDDGPSVAILVHGEYAAACRTSIAIRVKTSYRNLSLHAVTGGADALNRAAATRAEDLLLFLEAGFEPRSADWLARLVANASLPGVGAVGAKRVRSDGAVIDAGLTLGQRDGIAPAPAFAGLPADRISYFFYAEVTRNVSALSGSCLLTRRETFERLGGFDSRRYPRGLWSVDYCLRLRGIGLRSAYVADALLTGEPAESVLPPTELLALKRAYGRLADPFHNPNCSERDAWKPLSDSPLSLPAEAASPPVRALVVAHNLNNPEGAPRYLSEIVLGLLHRGQIAPTVFSPLGGPGAKVYTAEGVPVDVRESSFSRRFVDGLWSPREYDAAQKMAAAVLAEHRPDVVIANTLTTFPLVEAAARAGIPAVWIIHESYSREHLARLYAPFARRRVEQAFALAARVIPASHDTAALFEHLNTRGIFRVLHNGLDPRPFEQYLARTPKPASSKRIFLAVGTICERKGQHTLIEAAAILAQERRDFICELVGLREGLPYADYVRHLIERYKLHDVVRLVPETDAVWSHYRAADVFVCTSHLETFSRAILEAEAFGLPILSTPVSGVSEQVFWNANALRFDFGDAEGLANRMRFVLDEPALVAEMGRQSRAAFDNHQNESEMLDRYGAVILAAARHGPRAALPYESPLPARLRAA